MAVGSRRACCGARRVEGEEAGKGQEDAGTGGVLLMKSAYLNKREALDMQRCTLRRVLPLASGARGAMCVFVKRLFRRRLRISKFRTENRFVSECC